VNYLFIIQGEGRGHLSQAIALKEILDGRGDHVKKVYMGRNSYRQTPEYAEKALGLKPEFFRSPDFLRTKDRKGIRPIASVLFNLILAPIFFSEIFKLRKQIRDADIDIVVNFYDMLGGLANWISFYRKKSIVISHHYYLSSENFTFPGGFFLQKIFLRIHNRVCALRTNEILALSFVPGESKGKLKICPPLLRSEIRNKKTKNENFLLVYLLNEGFMDEIMILAEKHQDLRFKVYGPAKKYKSRNPGNIEICEPGQLSFLNDLSHCSALITTAGFESQCEAAFLGKPVYTIPSKNHFEQYCNALDGKKAGVSMDLSEFMGSEEKSDPDITEFKKWCDSGICF
jgi:uncharacterized protein (TIGR00661 family)